MTYLPELACARCGEYLRRPDGDTCYPCFLAASYAEPEVGALLRARRWARAQLSFDDFNTRVAA
jgi:hypothetical protein